LRAEQSRAEQSRAEQSRAEQSRAERAEQSRAEQAEQSRAEQSRVRLDCIDALKGVAILAVIAVHTSQSFNLPMLIGSIAKNGAARV
jgi:FtsZ-interacting cell division protein ZipA